MLPSVWIRVTRPGYDQRGLALSYSGQQGKAVADYTRAVELAPKASANPYNNRGWAHLDLGEFDKAVEDLSQAIRIRPDYQRAFDNRAKAYTQLKDWPHAIQDLTVSIQLNATSWASRTLAEAERATGDAKAAEEDLRESARLNSEHTAADSQCVRAQR